MHKWLRAILLGHRPHNEAKCSFCGVSYSAGGPLVEGPDEVLICVRCVEAAAEATDEPSVPTAARTGSLQNRNPYMPSELIACSFCGKVPPDGLRMSSPDSAKAICHDCVSACEDVIAEHQNPNGMLSTWSAAEDRDDTQLLAEPDPRKTWWGKFFEKLTPRPSTPPRRFEDGEPAFFYGVAFFVDPAERDVLHAALPSSEASGERMKRNVDEVVRVLPSFVHANPDLQSIIRGRRVVVRMIKLYAELDVEMYARVEVAPEIMQDAFSVLTSSGPS